MRLVAFALTAMVLAACGNSGGGGEGGSGGDGGGTAGSGGATTLLELEATGAAQASATVATALDEPIGIRVLDGDGAGVGRVDVRWTVLAGDGTLSHSTTRTNADGRTDITWTLGARAGINEVQASADRAEPVVFRVLGVPDAPHAAVILVGGVPTESLRIRESLEVVQLGVGVVDRHENAIDGSCEPTWESSAPDVVLVSSTGEVLPLGEGQATVIGRCDGLGGSIDFIVDYSPDRHVVVSPDQLEIAVGETVQLVATIFDRDGAELSNEAVTWASEDPQIATVDEDGFVTALWAGDVLIHAVSGDGVGIASLHVVGQTVPTAALQLDPSTLVLAEGESSLVLATALDEMGEAIEEAIVEWSSADQRIATVDPDGLVKGVMDGSTWIEARSGDVTESVEITVVGRIAFRRNYSSVHTMSSDGSDIQRLSLSSYDFAWSPDGSRSLFTVGGSIRATSVDGPNVQLTMGFEDYDPAWSPDGSTIAFTRRANGALKIHLMDADGSNVRMISDPETVHWDATPAWSPDGTILAFDSSGLMFTMNADGTNRAQILTGNRTSREPVWSPDGTRIAFSRANALAAGSHIAVVELASGDVTMLTDELAADKSPTWSPDGTRIAFASSREAGDVHWQIWVADERSSELKRLSDGTMREEGPSWRPPPQQ